MGYDEPSSKRHAAIAAAPPLHGRNPVARHVLVGLLLLGGAAYAAVYFGVVDSVTSIFSGPREVRRVAPTPPVRIAVAGKDDVPVMVHNIGTVLANSVVNVKPQIDGPLFSAMFSEGEIMKKAELHCRSDPAPYDAALRQAQATEARDLAQLASARADAERAMMLSERGIVSTQQRDQLVANSKALAATVEADVAAVDRAK